jgi:hypothetical protein
VAKLSLNSSTDFRETMAEIDLVGGVPNEVNAKAQRIKIWHEKKITSSCIKSHHGTHSFDTQTQNLKKNEIQYAKVVTQT